MLWLSAEFRADHPDVDALLRTMMKRTTVEGYRASVSAFIEMDFEVRLEALRGADAADRGRARDLNSTGPPH